MCGGEVRGVGEPTAKRSQRKRRRKRNLHHGDKQSYSPQGVVSMTVWFWITAQRTGKKGEIKPRWEGRQGEEGR